jgi:hypothetical protein
MAASLRQSHDGFLRRAAGLLRPAEICAESWAWQANCSEAELWAEAVRCWQQSRGHWGVASVRHTRIGAAMARGSDGRWFFTILTEE